LAILFGFEIFTALIISEEYLASGNTAITLKTSKLTSSMFVPANFFVLELMLRERSSIASGQQPQCNKYMMKLLSYFQLSFLIN